MNLIKQLAAEKGPTDMTVRKGFLNQTKIMQQIEKIYEKA